MTNILSLTLILAVLLGIIPALLPGNSYELEKEISRIEVSNWKVERGDCTVYMPHGEKRCDYGDVRTRGY